MEQVLFGLFTFALISVLVHRVELDYRRKFELAPVKWPETWLSLLLAGTYTLGYCLLERSSIHVAQGAAVGALAAILRGVWRVDTLLRLIPDRFQALGLMAGSLYAWGRYKGVTDPSAWLTSIFLSYSILMGLWLLSFLYERLRGHTGFGLGDIKLLAWLVLFIDKNLLQVLGLAVLLGIFAFLGGSIWQSIKERRLCLPKAQDTQAFAPMIILAVMIQGVLNYV